ncbi:unnamed protein product [Brassicogethes aeneus]|uniref:Protein CIP2A n=1 Tax=Brassicogethes aeneus TaxID=1431903 RepID=A0A9P0BHY2_BRAAE|nr:unnamed protein product [Brassicogethes aeneus]
MNMENVKKLIEAIDQHLKISSEDTASVISRNLQVLSVTIDLSVFDPHTNVAAQFYMSLYELLKSVEAKSPLAWYCVDVLSNCCRNASARCVLINTYHFLPSLTRLLSDQLTVEKKIGVLRLMQELSCGIKISWEIPHLPHLFKTLTKWIESGSEKIVTLSLGVLVNVCYQNVPAIYTLTREVDIQQLIRICMPLKGSVIELLVCKLLVILDYTKSVFPKDIFIRLVDCTFKGVEENIKSKDPIFLRQMVEFFLDTLKQESCASYTFNNNAEELKNLLEIIENNSIEPECLGIVFEFFLGLLERKLPYLDELRPKFIAVTLKWIQNDHVSSQALNILKSIAVNTQNHDNVILEPLIAGLPVYLLSLNTLQGNIPSNNEHNKKLVALLQLLEAMLKVDSLRDKVLKDINPESIGKVFLPLTGEEGAGDVSKTKSHSYKSMESVENTESINLYVYGLSLVNMLAKYDPDWAKKQTRLMQNREVHMVLAQALYCSPFEVRKEVMKMSALPNFPADTVARAMGNLQPMVLVNAPGEHVSKKPRIEPNFSHHEKETLDGKLKKLKSLYDKNLLNLSTSDVMELYEYKLYSMAHAERAAMASCEAASERCTHLQHRTAQLTAELNRLHQLLFRAQQSHEEAVKKKEAIDAITSNLQQRLEVEKSRCVKLSATEKQLKESLSDVSKKFEDVSQSKSVLEEQHGKLKQFCNKLEENGTRLERNLQNKEESLKTANANIHDLKTKVNELELLIKKKDFDIESKTAQLKEVTRNLMLREKAIESIVNLAANSKNSSVA